MIIRCPQCEHTRSITESKIPPTAELATCPKCKHRFRFRTLRREQENDLKILRPEEPKPPLAAKGDGDSRPAKEPLRPQAEVIRPQSAFRESAAQTDNWDAVDALHHRWQSQLDQHVVEIDHPALAASGQEASNEGGAEERKDAGGAAPADAAAQSARTGEREPAPPSGAEPFQPDSASGATAASRARASSPARADTLPLFALEERTPPFQANSPEAPARPDEIPAAPPPSAPEGLEPAPTKSPAVFPYGPGMEDAGAAEERVDQDMEMLKDTSPTRPLRDLGKLREFSDPDPDADDGEAAWAGSSSGIPWENPALYGWLKGFITTVHGVMFRAPEFFARFSGAGSLAPGYLFFLALGYLSILGGIAWSSAAAALLPELPPLLSHQLALPVLLLLAPVALGLMLLFVTGCIRLGLRLFAPDKADFALIYKIVSYSVAPFILSIVPFIGPPLGALWFAISLMLGCRYALGLPWQLAVSMPLLPAIMLLSGLVWYFL